MKKSTKRALAYAAVVIVIVLLAIPKLKGLWNKKEMTRESAAGKKTVLQLSGMVISQDTLSRKISIAGNLMPNEQVDIRPEVPGRIVEIGFQEGRKVHKGQLLIKLNDADLVAQLSRYEADKKAATDKLARSKQLLAKEAVSQEEYETDVDALAGIKANIQNLQAQIAKTNIYAPFDGTIGLRQVSLGSFVNSNDRIATLTATSPIKIDFSVPGKYADEIRPGRTIHFTVEGSKDSDYRATIYAIEPHIDPASRTLEVKALYPNKQHDLYPGAFANIILPIHKNNQAILIPNNALVPNIKGAEIYLYHNGKAQPRQVNIGMRTEADVQVISGLMPGDTVITSGIIQLHPGMPVEVRLKEY